jgi:hypothetical protein
MLGPRSYLSVYLYVRMEQLSFHWTDFDEIWYLSIFRKSVEKIQDLLKSEKEIKGALHEDLCTFMTASRWILLKIRNILNKTSKKNQNTHFMFNNFFPENRLWDNIEKYGTAGEATGDSIIWHMLQTHSEYLTLTSFHGKDGFANAPHCNVTRDFPLLYTVSDLRT